MRNIQGNIFFLCSFKRPREETELPWLHVGAWEEGEDPILDIDDNLILNVPMKSSLSSRKFQLFKADLILITNTATRDFIQYHLV